MSLTSQENGKIPLKTPKNRQKPKNTTPNKPTIIKQSEAHESQNKTDT